MGTTARHALPYPEDTDRVMDGNAAIQALAEAVDDELHVQRACIVPAAVQNMANATFVTMTFAVVEYDTAGMAELANNGIRVTEAGFYRITYKASFDSSGTGRRIATVKVNGAEVERIEGAPATFYLATLTVDKQLQAGDLVTAEQFHNAGAALTTYNSSRPRLSVTRT